MLMRENQVIYHIQFMEIIDKEQATAKYQLLIFNNSIKQILIFLLYWILAQEKLHAFMMSM